MGGNIFRDKKPIINAFEVSEDDPEFLRPREFTFVFFSPGMSRLRLLYGKRENYQQGTIQFSEVVLNAGEYVGRPCVQCKRPVASPDDCCLAVNQGQVVATVHESCFKKWFNASDKGQISPYRLVKARRRKLGVEGSSFKVQVNDGVPVDEYSFSALYPVDLKEVGTRDGAGNTLVQQPSGGFTGTPPQGMDPEEYVLQMSTLVQGVDSGGRTADTAPAVEPVVARPAARPAGPSRPAVDAVASVSRTVRVHINCPHCNSRLRVSIEHDPE